MGAAVSALSFLSILLLKGGSGEVAFVWIPSLGVRFSLYLDGLSTMMGLLASGIGVLVFLYAREYMHGKNGLGKFYTSMTVFLGSMLGLVFAGDLILLFVFWELTSLSSFMLIGFDTESGSARYAARKSLAITVGGGLFLLVAFAMVNSATGTFSIAELLSNPSAAQQSLRAAGLYVPAVAAMAIGAAAKSAQVPLHMWLPDAMEAPTPVSAFLHSATMVKAGVFLLARFRPVLLGEAWTAVLVPLGLLTMVVAGFLAVTAADIKELLAYSTASHLGLIAGSLGFAGSLGAAAGKFHILNHALFKASLFMVAGIVAHEAGTRKLSELSGLGRVLPVTAGVAVLGGLSMAGIPPLGGFQSKELVFKASLAAAKGSGILSYWMPALALIGSVLSFIYTFRFLSIFFGKPEISSHSPSRGFVLAPAVLAALVLAGSLLPQNAVDFLVQPAVAATTSGFYLETHLVPRLSAPLGMSAVMVLTGIAGFSRRKTIVGRGRMLFENHPWLSADNWYDLLMREGPEACSILTERVQHGRIRGYVTAAAVTTALAGISTALVALSSAPALGLLPGPAFILVLGISGLAALKLAGADSPVSGVLYLSVVGAMVAIFYVLADAPDLALTQVTVETLSLLIFLLLLDRLPSYYGKESLSKRARDTSIAGFVGASAFGAVVLATSADPSKISGFFTENALPEGGGGNVVNVILVDFRGFDTLGEISVVAMAALAVVVLLSARNRKNAGGEPE